MTMFRNPHDAFHEHDTCYVCRWYKSDMCPRYGAFIGRAMTNLEIPKSETEICHRYFVNEREQDRREQAIMGKLHENLNPNGETDYPF